MNTVHSRNLGQSAEKKQQDLPAKERKDSALNLHAANIVIQLTQESLCPLITAYELATRECQKAGVQAEIPTRALQLYSEQEEAIIEAVKKYLKEFVGDESKRQHLLDYLQGLKNILRVWKRLSENQEQDEKSPKSPKTNSLDHMQFIYNHLATQGQDFVTDEEPKPDHLRQEIVEIDKKLYRFFTVLHEAIIKTEKLKRNEHAMLSQSQVENILRSYYVPLLKKTYFKQKTAYIFIALKNLVSEVGEWKWEAYELQKDLLSLLQAMRAYRNRNPHNKETDQLIKELENGTVDLVKRVREISLEKPKQSGQQNDTRGERIHEAVLVYLNRWMWDPRTFAMDPWGTRALKSVAAVAVGLVILGLIIGLGCLVVKYGLGIMVLDALAKATLNVQLTAGIGVAALAVLFGFFSHCTLRNQGWFANPVHQHMAQIGAGAEQSAKNNLTAGK